MGCSAKLSLGGASPRQVSCWLAGSLGGAPPQETSASGLLQPWAPSREAGSLCYRGKSPGEPAALSVFPSVKWDCQTVCKLSGRSRPALSPGVDQENPFDPFPCISSTWPVIWQVMPDLTRCSLELPALFWDSAALESSKLQTALWPGSAHLLNGSGMQT